MLPHGRAAPPGTQVTGPSGVAADGGSRHDTRVDVGPRTVVRSGRHGRLPGGRSDPHVRM